MNIHGDFAHLAIRFGSEMAWDSTGQEGVYAWSVYFGDSTTATNTLNSILAYQPTVPHWGYNGNARRYWDNIYGGKVSQPSYPLDGPKLNGKIASTHRAPDPPLRQRLERPPAS